MPRVTPGSVFRDISQIAGRLPQAYALLTGREFGPSTPLQPDTGPAEQTQGPRQSDYPTAVNMVVTPRREYPQLQLQPFELLRSVCRSYDVAAICIATIIEEMQALDWTVAARDDKRQKDLQAACDFMNSWWKSPDKQSNFATWFTRLLESVLSIDALTIYKQLDVGGQLYALELVDGATIKPVLDDRGFTVAYQQVIHGLPFSQYIRAGLVDRSKLIGEFGSQEIIYKPRWVKVDSPYGSPPIERVLTRANIALRKSGFDLAWFDAGNIPQMFMSPPKETGQQMTPAQIKTFEQDYNADMEGDDAARNKIKILPWTPGYIGQGKTFVGDPAFEMWLMKLTAAGYSVQPAEIGFTDTVNKSSSEGQQNVQYRRGIGPLCQWLKLEIFDPVIANEFGLSELEWRWSYGEKEDDLAQAQIDDIYIKNGTLSADEVRHLRFAQDVSGPAPTPATVQSSGASSQQAQSESSSSSNATNVADLDSDDSDDDDDTDETETKAALTTGNDLEKKSRKTGPGSRGGKYWIDGKGNIRYGPPPSGKTARTPQGWAKFNKSAAKKQLKGVKTDGELAKAGWETVVTPQDVGGDPNASNFGDNKDLALKAANQAATQNPKTMFVVLRVQSDDGKDAHYVVASKLLSDIQNDANATASSQQQPATANNVIDTTGTTSGGGAGSNAPSASSSSNSSSNNPATAGSQQPANSVNATTTHHSGHSGGSGSHHSTGHSGGSHHHKK